MTFPLTHDTAATPAHDGSARLLTASVCGRTGEWLLLRMTAAEQRALRAPSCLLQPEIGDVVLVCESAPVDRAAPLADARVATLSCYLHVLAVLSRAQGGSGTLELPGGARLQADDGALALQGREVRVEARERLHACAPELVVDAAQGDLRLGRVQATAQKLSAVMGEVQLFGKRLHSRFDWLVQKARNSVREVDELDDLRAGRTRWDIEGHAQLHAKQATVLADGAVKIDGSRIDLG